MSHSEKGKKMNAGTPQLLIYTTPTCPDCHALKRWLAQQKIAYEERDLTDPLIAEEAKTRTGVRVAPISIVGDQVFYGTFLSQKPGLMKALGLSDAQLKTSEAQP
ncbi:glutaredoxin family protein [Pseudochrobactrum asaccharolyticum]|uniref:glutaredoxin family protein n=1 Tax=Pseudochrobactrum asaccharolyticum TaxID=354351 RepID=UPI0040424C0F